MKTVDDFKSVVRMAVGQVAAGDFDDDMCFVDRASVVNPVDLLYVFDELERALKLPVCNILMDHTAEVMTVTNLANALFAMHQGEN